MEKTEITKMNQIYKFQKDNGYEIITKEKYPIVNDIMENIQERLLSYKEKELYSYYCIDKDYQSIVLEMFNEFFHYETIDIYNESEQLTLKINKLH